MALILKSISQTLLILRTPNGLKNQLTMAKFVLVRSGFTVRVECMQSSRYVHSSSVYCSKKMREIKEKQKIKDYSSERKKRKVCDVWTGMTIEELGQAMGKDTDHVFELMKYVDNTVQYNSSQNVLDWITIADILTKAHMRFRQVAKPKPPEPEEDHDVYPRPPADESKLKRRPAVVTIMGHVDHGKTTLLDYLRKSSIVDSEFGGITQHIGAFSVKVNQDSITFLDTPGHAAFKAMRSRGAHCTDIVILVVAADDGVMEQTVESINMARSAEVPIIVAINKIDKGNADIERTKKMLSMQGLVPEDLKGDVQCVPISALKGTNVDALIDAIITQAELCELRADPDGMVEGVIIESKVDPHRGKLSTALIRRGTLRDGCFLTAGLAWCKVKKMLDEHQNIVKKALPSTPVEIVGWRVLPTPGDIILEVESEKRVREVIEAREKKAKKKKMEEAVPEIQRQREKHLAAYKPKLLEKRKLGVRKLKPPDQMEKQNQDKYYGPQLNIIVKSDVEGSLEALISCLSTYHDPRCRFDVVANEVGSVSVGDIEVAEAFQAVVYNFNVDVLPDAAELAQRKKISIRPHNIIYRFLEDVKKELNSRLPELEKEETTAEAVVQELFLINEKGNKKVPVAGCRCVFGELKKQVKYKVIRDEVEVHRGNLSSMRNMKTEVTVIRKDQECGLRFEDTSFVVKPGDIIQSFRTYTVPQEIDWNPY